METMKAIKNRQSCRAYKEEQITEQELQTILETANAAPVSMGKFDEVRLTVVQNQGLMKKLDAAGAKFFGNPDMHPLYNAPTVIIVSAAVTDIQKNPSPYCNAACVVENIAVAATDLGLGSVYLLGAVIALGLDLELSKEFKVPEGFVPASAIAVGKPAMALEERNLTVSKFKTEYLK
jgi:nitroreductase